MILFKFSSKLTRKSRLLALTRTVLLLSFYFTIQQAIAAPDADEGNHTWAKSEAWTWMGHVNEVNDKNGQWELSSRGFGFIHYYCRNDTGMGHLNFKSSAVTPTLHGIGIDYDSKTVYPSIQKKDFQIRIREDALDIEFQKAGDRDHIFETPLSNEDLELVDKRLMPLFTGLEYSPSWILKKYFFRAKLGRESKVNLTFYSLWPVISPPDKKMTFLGLENSFTFSAPMLLTYGEWIHKNGKPIKVAGLSFLDRQWSKDYFGKKIFEHPDRVMKAGRALIYSHNWSAFHAYSSETKNWYFIHLWQQIRRQDGQPDLKIPFSEIQWTKNGIPQESITADQFNWSPLRFVQNQSKVLFNYAQGRLGFFPFTYELQAPLQNIQLKLSASPPLQSLNQPIYLFEGYAEGEGIWEGTPVKLRGRIESSQLLFRDLDYDFILSKIDEDEPQQRVIRDSILKEKAQGATHNQSTRQDEFTNQLLFLSNDPLRKYQIGKSPIDRAPRRIQNNVMVYY